MAGIPESLPVFSLPKVVLFPNADLPLRIYDEPTVRLVDDAMKGERLLLVCQARSYFEEPESGEESPELYPVGTVALITATHRARDGSLNVFVHGLTRAELGREVSRVPYRVCVLRPLDDDPESTGRDAVVRDRAEILHRFYQAGTLGILGPFPSGTLGRLEKATDPNFLALSAALLGLNGDQQQHLLELSSLVHRFRLLTETFTSLLLSHATLGDAPQEAEGEFSH